MQDVRIGDIEFHIDGESNHLRPWDTFGLGRQIAVCLFPSVTVLFVPSRVQRSNAKPAIRGCNSAPASCQDDRASPRFPAHHGKVHVFYSFCLPREANRDMEQ